MSARVLVVDDMLPSVKMLAAKLTGEYYDVFTATDGPGALAAVHDKHPDVILLDVMMPGMDGYEVCRRLKADPETAAIPVVLVTALSGGDERVRGLEAGADDFLTKPVSDATLFARVRSLVRLKQMLDQWRLREETTQMMGALPFEPPMPADGSGARLVLVDDSAIEAANVNEFLAEDRVMVIGDVHRAEALIMADLPDVILVALRGDDDAPLRLCTHLRSLEATRHVPILLIGDDADTDWFVKALELGINDYVVRPLDGPELTARVRTQVRRKRYHDRLRAGFLESLSLALTDSLTGLHNRRYLSTHLEAVMKRMADGGKPVALLMIDVDHFKAINDTHGHLAGDAVLCEVAQRLAHNVRGVDMVARYGGEEFVVVMPDTGLAVAQSVAERLRADIADVPIRTGAAERRLTATVSIGIAMAAPGASTPLALIEAADRALYTAKAGGRNRVVVATAAG